MEPITQSIVGRVLVIDDDLANRNLLVRLLTGEGHTASGVPDGERGLASITQTAPDLVLLDVNLPGVDGFEVCRRVKGHPDTRLIPVVLVTGEADRVRRIHGIESGADDFLSKPIDVQELKARVRSLLKLKRSTDDLESVESVVVALAETIEARDTYTRGHCERLASSASALGRRLALSEDQRAALVRGAYLHDIGKIAIPDAILRKPGPLTDAEFEILKQHPAIGERLCGNLKSLGLVKTIIRSHHERRDGSGYPDHLAGDAVPLLAEIVAVVDVFDALTTDRPYRQAIAPAAAACVLRDEMKRGMWRPGVVEAFLRLPGVAEVEPARPGIVSLSPARGPAQAVQTSR